MQKTTQVIHSEELKLKRNIVVGVGEDVLDNELRRGTRTELDVVA